METSKATRITAGALTGVAAALTLFNSAAAGATPANDQPASPAASVQQVQNQAPRVSTANFNGGSAINTVPALVKGNLTAHFAPAEIITEPNGIRHSETVRFNDSMHPTWTKWSIIYAPGNAGESAWARYDGWPPPNAEDFLPHFNPGTGHIDRMGDGPGVLGHN